MVIKLNRIFWIIILSICAILLIIYVLFIKSAKTRDYVFMGGSVYSVMLPKELTKQVFEQQEKAEDYSERYQRPSKAEPLPNAYKFQSFENKNPPPIKNPEDVIYAYFGILKEAANMQGYAGGCGTIGDATAPYPYAYNMLSEGAKKEMSLQQFTDSFIGTGHLTFLKLHPAYAPENTPKNTRYYMFEIETITGPKSAGEPFKYMEQLNYFAYYYGIITVVYENGEWKIETIRYLPEEFLCAPYHSWFYDSSMIVPIIYQENLKLIDKVTNTEEKNGLISIYASGNGKQYRFDFVRLTNGHDILLHEYIYENDKWVEVHLVKDAWRNFKLSILNSDLNPCAK